MLRLANKRELYDYLGRLVGILSSSGHRDLAAVVSDAMGTASSLSTEFLGESRIALRRVAHDSGLTLSAQERADLDDVLKQLDETLSR